MQVLQEICMRQQLVRNVLFGVTALLLIGASFVTMHVGVRANSDQRMTMKGQIGPFVQQAHLLQATDPNQQLTLSVSLQLRNQADLNNVLSSLYNPQSAEYHHYLTPDEFNQLFAPTSDQAQAVVAFLQSQGLTVSNVASNNLLIDATGSVAQVDQAFHTQINNYKLGSHTFYSNAFPPSVPASISQLITAINGLDNSVNYQPLYQMQDSTGKPVRHWNPPGTRHRPGTSGLINLGTTPTGFGPKDLAAAYDSTPLQNAGVLGDNQTVALFELDGYSQNDVAQYFQYYSLGTPNISNVLVDNVSGIAGMGAIEVELDIEVVAAIAPHANQVVYEGPNTFTGINDTYNRIVTDNKAKIATTSWGLCEASSGPGELQTLDSIFKQEAAQGISFFAAAGDTGAYDCGDNNLAVDSPASDPYVTAVGGTSLQLNSGTYGSESVWSNPNDTHRSPKGAGGGGGVSKTFAMQSWQSGPGVQNGYTNGNREVPDVTGDADPATGYAMYCTVVTAGCPATGWLKLGGTSASAPLWAGNTALINQYLQSQGKAVLGYANPQLYSIFNNNSQPYSAFHDINSGNNLFYSATVSYDLASGIGSPDAYNLARDLVVILPAAGSPTPIPTITPSPTPTNTPSPTPTPSPPPAPAIIQNGGLENGSSPWQESSSGGYEMVATDNPHTGTYSVYFCGYMACDDRISQVFTVPTNYKKITLTYWWYADTNKTTKQCQDTFNSQLQTTSGTKIGQLQSSCNTDATNAWVQKTFDVSQYLANYKGKQVSLFFEGTNANGQYQTSDFFVDDVVVNVS